jgi:hypothetical protein
MRPAHPRRKARWDAGAQALAHPCDPDQRRARTSERPAAGTGRAIVAEAQVAVAQVVRGLLAHLLLREDHTPSTELGADDCARLDPERLQRRSVQRLEQLGYPVTLTPAPAA